MLQVKIFVLMAKLAFCCLFLSCETSALSNGDGQQKTWQFATNLKKDGVVSVERQVNAYFNGIKCVVSDFVQISNGKKLSGKFVLSKKSAVPGSKDFVSVSYLNCAGSCSQKIFIKNGKVDIFDICNHKKYSYSAAQVPVYSLLTGAFDLSKMKHSVVQNTAKVLKIKIYEKYSFTLVFSKYDGTLNLKNLEGWEIADANRTAFVFVPGTFFVNDYSKIDGK